MALELLIAEAQDMPDDALMEVVRFVRFIKEEARRAASAAPKEQPIIRKAGKYRGKIVIADDFDAPLDDFKAYM